MWFFQYDSFIFTWLFTHESFIFHMLCLFSHVILSTWFIYFHLWLYIFTGPFFHICGPCGFVFTCDSLHDSFILICSFLFYMGSFLRCKFLIRVIIFHSLCLHGVRCVKFKCMWSQHFQGQPTQETELIQAELAHGKKKHLTQLRFTFQLVQPSWYLWGYFYTHLV